MSKACVASVLACAMLFASGGAALAAVAGEFGNYCAMGLVNGEKKLTEIDRRPIASATTPPKNPS